MEIMLISFTDIHGINTCNTMAYSRNYMFYSLIYVIHELERERERERNRKRQTDR